MADGQDTIQVGVALGIDEFEQQFGRNGHLRRRIAQVSGAEPVFWDGRSPAPEIEALLVDDVSVIRPELAPRLRLVQLLSAGSDGLRETPLWRSDVPIATASGVHGVQIPEHVFMLLLALRRDLRGYLDAQRRHEWAHDTPTPDELYGRTLGLVGYGHIGRGVAHLARAFGMRVLATSPSVRERTVLAIPGVAPFVDPPAVPGPHLAPDELLPLDRLHELLSQSDVVVICAPLTPRTQGMIDAAALGCMKRGSYLINIARGKIVAEEALAQALREGRLAGAGLDVTDDEPLPAESPLWELPNVIITPHVSGKTARYLERVVNILLANVERLRRGEPLLNAVDRGRGY